MCEEERKQAAAKRTFVFARRSNEKIGTHAVRVLRSSMIFELPFSGRNENKRTFVFELDLTRIGYFTCYTVLCGRKTREI